MDVALHSEDALREVLRRLPDWNLALRRKGRKTFPDAHFEDEAPTLFRLDLFTATSNPTWDRVFGRHGFQNIKVVPRVLLPGLAWAVEDKLATIPKRRGPDAKDKRAKDFIDIYHLVLHNREGMLPQELGGGNAVAREEALAFLQGARTTRSEYAGSYEALERWLST